ncbi:hypothetical protein SS1G_10098 [Sclerotinia sclerotiorum 1980 UF-70]|uniref:Uncharacterized protein n=1 Tax=Sclerotinia sclerotiorum (strain ATCC 18683 / 1980 / Ss-1) TaxID=665079 RepID=A7EXN3_SCLS1|nr:hypothetical protein SS1G_10098 [Sclerotinia sclerotiorum 1980 UF-70]EDN94225.1 hypothetical protein SS1G_10098 [Sclerotinia sclerotiorum 1980 UF-70]
MSMPRRRVLNCSYHLGNLRSNDQVFESLQLRNTNTLRVALPNPTMDEASGNNICNKRKLYGQKLKECGEITKNEWRIGSRVAEVKGRLYEDVESPSLLKQYYM